MSDRKKPRKRIVDAPEKRKIEDPVKIGPSIERRTAGILGYYAKTRGVSESIVVETALTRLFAGWKITDPDNQLEDMPAA